MPTKEQSNRLADLVEEQAKRTLPMGSGALAVALRQAREIRSDKPGGGMLLHLLAQLSDVSPREGECLDLLRDEDGWLNLVTNDGKVHVMEGVRNVNP